MSSITVSQGCGGFTTSVRPDISGTSMNDIIDDGKQLPAVHGIEILCHNLSHSDLVLSVNDQAMSHPNGRILARPVFSHYREVSGKVVRRVANEEHLAQIPTLLYPICSRRRGEDLGTQYVEKSNSLRLCATVVRITLILLTSTTASSFALSESLSNIIENNFYLLVKVSILSLRKLL